MQAEIISLVAIPLNRERFEPSSGKLVPAIKKC